MKPESTFSHSRIDSIHVHVDGGGDPRPVEEIVERLKNEGFVGTTTKIIGRAEGPQREDERFVPTYEIHTPGPEGNEVLEFFSTTLLAENLKGWPSIAEPMRKILTMLSEQQDSMQEGIVVEVERVIGKGEEEIGWTESDIDDSYEIQPTDVGFVRRGTAPIEIHYAFDVPKKGRWTDTKPIELSELTQGCRDLGIRIGGWFLFVESDDMWSYRSNQFTIFEKKGIAQDQRAKLQDYLERTGRQRGFESKPRALVEQILGVWRTPLQPVDSQYMKNVAQLADWECCSADLSEFWVFTPNFLGDTRGEVRQAMIRNLKKRVRYTYFLRSFADMLRLRSFADSLQSDVGAYPRVSSLIEAVLLEPANGSSRDVFEEEYFIANPNNTGREGYRLLRNRRGRIFAGERMQTSDFENVDMLAMFFKQKPVTNWLRTPLSSHVDPPKLKAVACVMLGKDTQGGEKLSEQAWEIAWNEFDQIVADSASKRCGIVVKASVASYFVIFEDVIGALKFAGKTQKGVREYNKQNSADIPSPRVAIDHGHVERRLRSYGFDFIGHPLVVCSKLVEQVSDSEVLLTKAVEDNIPPAARESWKIRNESSRLIDELGRIVCKELDWE
jgi:hypothetical protein